MQYIFGCIKYIFNNGGSKMDKDMNVFGPVILTDGNGGNDLPEHPKMSDESETVIQ